jgi:hypothetical protein
MKKYLPSLVIKEIQIQPTVRFQLIPIRIDIIKNTKKKPNTNEDMQQYGMGKTHIHFW